MKIFELKITPKIQKVAHDYFKSVDHEYEGMNLLQSKLKKMGWKRVGEGVYSHVWSNPNKKICS